RQAGDAGRDAQDRPHLRHRPRDAGLPDPPATAAEPGGRDHVHTERRRRHFLRVPDGHVQGHGARGVAFEFAAAAPRRSGREISWPRRCGGGAEGQGRNPGMARVLFTVLVACWSAAHVSPAGAGQDPNRTVTVYVHGFDWNGADRHGAYGVDVREPLEDSLAAMAGLPVADTTGGPIAPNAVTATTYYGDVAPSWYSPADLAEIARRTAAGGGGVPRYAYIVARFAQHALERSGADQVNLVGASFGGLITRWVIEKDVLGLASGGRIARWLTIEGVVAGNWAASR